MGEAGFGQEVMGLRSKLPAVPSGAAPGAHYPTGTRGDIQAVTNQQQISISLASAPLAARAAWPMPVTQSRSDSDSDTVTARPRR